MKIFLAKPDAAFYHITRRNNWENGIQQHGLNGDSKGKIFVSRSDDEGVLASIALNQILDTDEDPDLVVLKLRHSTNEFKLTELSFDIQANETTLPFQSIINRQNIPLEKIQFHSYIRMSVDELGTIANRSDANLPTSEIFHDALKLVYEQTSGGGYKLEAVNDHGVWSFEKRSIV